jgi:multidrug efflux system outer membrane protein
MKSKRAACGGIIAAWLAGCTVGPNYHGPPAEESTAPAKFKNGDEATGNWKVAEPADAQARGAWWTIFHEPELNELENQAGAANPDVRVAAGRVVEARALDRVAASQFYPDVTFAGSAVRQRTTNTGPKQLGELVGSNPFGGAGATPAVPGMKAPSAASSSSAPLVLAEQPLSTTYSLFRAPLELSWELDLFGRLRRNYESYRAQREAIEKDYQNVTLSVAANVAVNYFALRSLDAEIAILNRALADRREALRISEERLEAGLTSELDVTRAKADLASDESDLFAVQRTRGEVENAIGTLVGRPASLVHLSTHPLSTKNAPPRVPTSLPSKLLERRPDVAEAERQLASANAQIGVAKAAFFPVIRLTGEGGFESADIRLLFNWQSRIWTLGPSITLPIFEGGKNIANLKAAHARYDEAVGRYRGQVLTAFQDVENALDDLHQLAGQAEADERALAAAQRSLLLARQQYAKGQVNFLDVLDAERTALADERLTAQLAGQRMQSTVQLVKALGGGWH